MKLLMDINLDIISDAVRNFSLSHDLIAAVYLFGSAARGNLRESSDVDIAVMTTSQISTMKRINWETELSNILRRDVDLVVFSQVGSLLQHQVLKYGKLVYEKNPKERVKQVTSSRREYLDTRFLYRELVV